jgi:hypothetical protein
MDTTSNHIRNQFQLHLTVALAVGYTGPNTLGRVWISTLERCRTKTRLSTGTGDLLWQPSPGVRSPKVEMGVAGKAAVGGVCGGGNGRI